MQPHARLRQATANGIATLDFEFFCLKRSMNLETANLGNALCACLYWWVCGGVLKAREPRYVDRDTTATRIPEGTHNIKRTVL